MPTQRAHGGAPLIPINLTTPGIAGLNTEAEATLLGPEWATQLSNVVFDSAGRAATRKGFATGTATPVAGVLKRLHEFIKADASVEVISSTDADIFTGVATPSSIEGTLGITEGNIKFVNFNNKCIALGTGTSSNPSVYTGAGNFATVTVATGTAPTSGIGTAAFGRLWVVDSDGFTIRYSALLDETKWHVDDGGGTIDMSMIWSDGQDIVTAISSFGGDLVVFGRKSIVIWTDGQGSSIGLSPNNIYIADTIASVGAVSQFAMTHALGDLWFIGPAGLHSMSRVLQDKTTPTMNMSRNVQSKFLGYLDAETDLDDLTLTYSPREEFVLATFPTSGKTMCFDTRLQLQDGTFRASEWTVGLQTTVYLIDRSMRASLTDTVGEVMTYTGQNDNAESFSFSYESGWLDLGQELSGLLKYVKKLTSFVFVGSDTTLNFTLKYDFQSNPKTIPTAVVGSIGAQFNLSEFSDSAGGIGYADPANIASGESEFSGGVSLRAISAPGKGGGQYIKVGVHLDNAKGTFALQHINLFAKIGRIAT